MFQGYIAPTIYRYNDISLQRYIVERVLHRHRHISQMIYRSSAGFIAEPGIHYCDKSPQGIFVWRQMHAFYISYKRNCSTTLFNVL